MKTPLRFQSRLLVSRSYKPARANRRTLGIAFRPASRFSVKVSKPLKPEPLESSGSDTITQSE